MNDFRVGFMSGFLVFLYMMVFFGTATLVARRYEHHPAAKAWLSLYNG